VVDAFSKLILDGQATYALNRILKDSPRTDGSLESRVATLAEQNYALAGELLRVRAALAVVAEALVRSNGVDCNQALARMRELLLTGDEPTVLAFHDPTEPRIKVPVHEESTDQPSEAAFECQRCKKMVPAHASCVTSQGTLCASCYAASPA
jgi:hypothetical protein